MSQTETITTGDWQPTLKLRVNIVTHPMYMFKTYQFLQQLHTRQVITTKEFHPGYTYDTVTTEYKWMDVEIGEYTNNEFNPEEQNDTKKEDQKEEKVD